MAINKKFLSTSDDTVTKRNKSTVTLSHAVAGLQNDFEKGEVDLSIEIDLSEIKNLSIEIELELKIASVTESSIETDREALAKEAVNRDVLDYSIKSFNNQMTANNRGDLQIETSESAGMQSAMDTIGDGLRYILENKQVILSKAWEKLKELYSVLVKKIKEYYRKGFYALHKMINMPSKVFDLLSGFSSGQIVQADMLSEESTLQLYKGFAIFAMMNFDEKGREFNFDFSDSKDTLRLEQVFSSRLFLDINTAAKDGMLRARDVDLLTMLSSKEILKKYFNYSLPSNFNLDESILIPISFNASSTTSKTTIIDYAIASNTFYTNDSLDLNTASINSFKAVIKPETEKELSFTLSTVGDLSRVNNALINFNTNVLGSIEESQSKGLSLLEKKVNSLNVNDKDMQSKFKTYKGIYDMLSAISITNLMGLINSYARAVRALELIALDVQSYNEIQKAKATAGM